MVSFFMGSISNGILSKILKKILKQERPAGLDESSLDLPPSDNGMPSSHAMSLGFIGTFTALQLPWTTIPILIYVMISLMYRVRANLHSAEQIVVGVILGSFNGMIWRSFCFGNNFLGINVMDWVSATFLNDQGLLPWYGLAVPALVGAAVVGSVERRVSRFLKNKPE
jgi:membrane-associated phospholipid phosphatase